MCSWRCNFSFRHEVLPVGCGQLGAVLYQDSVEGYEEIRWHSVGVTSHRVGAVVL